MGKGHPVQRAIGHAFHRAVASSVLASKAYFGLLSAVKKFPDGPAKNRLLNSLRSVRWPALELPPSEVLVGSFRFRMVPHFDEFDFDAFLARRLNYEAEVIEFFSSSPHEYDAIVLVGANVGIYALFFSALCPKAAIYAFEPSRKAFDRLRRNLELNPSANVRAFHAAAGPAAGIADFYEPEGHLMNGSLKKEFAQFFSPEVRSTRVEVWGPSQVADLCGGASKLLVKVDAEGCDAEILAALSGFIRDRRPDLLIECLAESEAGLNALGLHADYELRLLSLAGPIVRDRFQADASARDYFLSPRGR